MATTTAMTMKLLVDPKAERVLFAEASKDVVDFLFSLLVLPVGLAVKHIGKKSMVGSFGNLYASVEKVDGTYVQPGAAKAALLRPTMLSPVVSANSSLFLLPDTSSVQSNKFFKCSYGSGGSYCCGGSYLTDTSGTKCPSCSNQMTTPMQLVSSAGSAAGPSEAGGGAQGFVQGIVMYTVMDNLTVKPMISSIDLFKKFKVKDHDALQEKTVKLGYKEGSAILKASLQSNTVLTDFSLERIPQLGLEIPVRGWRGQGSTLN